MRESHGRSGTPGTWMRRQWLRSGIHHPHQHAVTDMGSPTRTHPYGVTDVSTAITNKVNGTNYLGVRFACEEGGHGQPFWQRSVSPERMNGEKNSMLLAGQVSREEVRPHFPPGSAQSTPEVRETKNAGGTGAGIGRKCAKMGVEESNRVHPRFFKGCENKDT